MISLRMAARCRVTNKSVKASGHDEQRNQQAGVDGRPAHAEHRGRLVQRVPPVHRELDDGQVDGADQRQDRGGTAGAGGIVDGAPQRDQAEIHQEQHQHRGEPRVPHPIGPPHRAAPQRAGDQGEEGEGGAQRRRAFGGDVGERMPPHQGAERGQAHHPPHERAQPGVRHVDVHDLDRRALLVIVRSKSTRRAARSRRRAPSRRSATAAPARRARGSGSGLARSMRAMPQS